MTLDEFEKKANSFMAKRNSTNINKNVANNETKSDLQKFEEKANKFLEKRNNTTNTIVSNTPQKTITEKMDSLWVESTAPNVLQKQNINATVKPLNISTFVKDVKDTAEQNRLKVEEDIAKAGYKSSDFTEEQKKQLISGNYSINPTYNPDNKFSQKLIYTGDANIKATPSLGQSVANVAEKTGRTAMDLTAAAATGVVRGYEGLADVAIGNVGNFASQVTSLGGLKPNNVSENIRKGTEKIVGYGLAGEMDKLAAEKRAEGAGSYNPNILGMGARDMVSEGARMFSLAPLGMPGFIGSAAGNNIEQAINEGEKLPNAVMYGNITGTIEGATEKLFDTFNVIGGGKLDKFLPKSAIGKFVSGAAGEGIEEMISQAVNPFTKILTYEQDVENPFGSIENFTNYLKDVGEAGLQGFAMGMFMQGAHDISSSDIRNQYKTEITNAVNKIKGVAENSKQSIIDGMMAGASRFKIPSNSQINEAQNQAQSQNVEQGNVTLPTRAETAQNANMEKIVQTPNLPTQKAQETLQSAKNDNFHKGLEKFNSKKFNDNDNIVVLEETPLYLYNLGYDSDKPIVLNMSKLETIMKEPKGTFEGKNQHGITMDVIEQLPNAIQNPLNVIRNPKFRDRFVVITELTDQYGDIVIVPIEMNTNGYIENIETDVNRIASVYGKENYDLAKRDGLNSYIENNKNNIVYDIDNDVTKNKSSVINPRLQLSSTNNTASINSINQNDLSVNTQYAQTKQNDTSTYISPVSDLQGATEFVNKATIKDVETLQKMVDEAEKNPDRVDLQFFAEKARAKLEKLSREQVESMLEEGINQNKISYGDSIYRNLRRTLGEKGYKYVKENILDKLDSAKLDNVNMKIEIANELKSYVVDGLGIKKGSKESELVQKYGEKEITLDELKEATPNWENVVKADDWFRSKYDELIDRINESRAEIYPYIEEKIEATELELKVVKQQIKDIEENGTPNFKKDAEIRTQIENIQNRIDSKTKALEEAKNKNTLKYKNNLRIKNEAEQRLGELNDLLEIRTENKLYKLTEKAEKLQNILDSEELWRGKRIPKRKDYYRHFQEMTEGFEALGNILSTPSEISNNLSGISENTKPSSKWLGLAQRRLTNKTKYDAVGGFLNYLDSASYAINIDPEIKRIRDFTEEIRNASEDNTANRLIEYLTDYANDLAGKTNPMDRYIQKVIPGGRKTMKAISWVTNRIKSNAVLGNFNSAAAQILNIPQGLADIKNPKNIAIGFWETLTGDKDGKYKNSQFITERFNSDVYSQFNERLIDQPKKLATWLLGALDEFGTKTIWNGEYSKAVDIGIKDPVRYADYRTRDLVAGRGIGELSLNQRSKTIGLLAPFTVEVSNYWGVVKDFISAKDFGGIVLLQVFAFLFNKGLEELGVSAGVFDLIDALIDAWNTEGGIDKKAGRVAGEFLSNTMFGQQIAGLYPENGADLGFYQLPTRSELFGDADPTRMGTGSVLSKAISNPVTSVVLPWGGTQVNKTTQGLKTFAEGGAYSKDAEGNKKLKYPVEQNLENFAKSALFGKWSTEGAKQYIDSGFKALSANQTEGYEKAKKAGISDKQFYDAYNAQKKIKDLDKLTSLVKKNEIDKATKGLSTEKRKILYETFGVAKGEWDNTRIVFPYEIKAQKEKLAREKLKTEKK